MAVNIDSKPLSLPFSGDLSASLFRFGKLSATGIAACSVQGEKSDGVIGAMYTAKTIDASNTVAGNAGDFYTSRMPIVEAGGVIAAGVDVTTDNVGRAIAAGAGDVVNGRSVDAAGAAGAFLRILPPFAKPTAQNVADGSTQSGGLVVYTRTIADAASADYDVVVAEKVEVIDVIVRKQSLAAGANANTVQVKSTGNVISDAISVNGKAVGDLVRAANINPANNTINAGGTMRVSIVKAGGDAAVAVDIICVKRA